MKRNPRIGAACGRIHPTGVVRTVKTVSSSRASSILTRTTTVSGLLCITGYYEEFPYHHRCSWKQLWFKVRMMFYHQSLAGGKIMAQPSLGKCRDPGKGRLCHNHTTSAALMVECPRVSFTVSSITASTVSAETLSNCHPQPHPHPQQ